jgi:hypothetical protein
MEGLLERGSAKCEVRSGKTDSRARIRPRRTDVKEIPLLRVLRRKLAQSRAVYYIGGGAGTRKDTKDHEKHERGEKREAERRR